MATNERDMIARQRKKKKKKKKKKGIKCVERGTYEWTLG